MQRKQGISLIVLVTTIIVMIILAASVVISLSNTGIIDRANQAVNLTDERQVQELASLAWVDAYWDNDRVDSIETVVKEKLEEQGVTEDKWNIIVTDNGVTVTKKNPNVIPEAETTIKISSDVYWWEITAYPSMTWEDIIIQGIVPVKKLANTDLTFSISDGYVIVNYTNMAPARGQKVLATHKFSEYSEYYITNDGYLYGW